MAIYHLEAKVVSRGAGRSAVAASAYLSCSRLYNDYDGIQHDYTKKQGLLWQQVFLPEYALQEWQDREKLWNAVEEVETAKDSRLAREFVVALPIELSREQQIELLQDFIREQFVADGMCADAAIHDTDGHNPHAHILHRRSQPSCPHSLDGAPVGRTRQVAVQDREGISLHEKRRGTRFYCR